MPRVKTGVQLQPQHTTIEPYGQAWLRADELGVDSIWHWDHVFPSSGDPNGPHFEGWTTLAAFGAQTKRATIGCLVFCMSYRNPALLSNMAKTLDHVVGGRLILGVGAGWFEREYQEYGYEFGTAGQRLKNLERGIETIRERWAKDVPKPVRGTIPILVGGSGEKVTLRIVAQHADLWNFNGKAEDFRRKNELLNEWCRTVERDPAAIERVVSIHAHELDALDAFVEAGAQHLVLRVGHPFDMGPVERLLDWRERQKG
jgi:probable F420-dependent oxidoreductase